MLAAELCSASLAPTTYRGQIPPRNQSRLRLACMRKRTGENRPVRAENQRQIYGLLTAGMESTSVAESPTVISMLLD